MIRNLRKLLLLYVIAVTTCSHKHTAEENTVQTNPPPEAEPSYSFSDMVLCYGGSAHRKPFLWDSGRFADYVSCIGKSGKEEWLFDGFLFLEFCRNDGDGIKWSYLTGYSPGNNRSANKTLWQEHIDYWFKEGNGFSALEKAVSEAAARIGEAAHKRKVVISIPDPILHLHYDEPDSPTRYWGELNGKQLDFKYPEDRIAACQWFVDEVLERFERGKFKNIELEGFYYISEEIATPDEGWCYELKKLDLVLPEVSSHLHKKGKKVYWIPYRHAASYHQGGKFGIDFVWMQPNYFWHADKYPIEESMRWITDAGVGMEIEMDENLLSKQQDSELYRMRFRKYMENAKNYRLYGKFPFTYYIGNDAFRELKHSEGIEDKKMFGEFCNFVISNPVRNRCK